MPSFDFKAIEEKWKKKFDNFDGFKGVDLDKNKEKFYMLTEFPYPSGTGLHVGHAFSMTAADVYARFQRRLGKNVMFPMGWDAFGLPAENYAIKTGISPQVTTKEVTGQFRRQMDSLGFSFDWDREVNTTHADYYKWTQWIFTKLFEKGLAYKKEMPINWCPKDKTGLANEEVIDGKCERCGTQTEKRTLSQWVVKITDYADRLIEGLGKTEFIEKVKAAQINWIGKKDGAKIKFKLSGSEEEIEVFTTRADTLEGATFMVLAPEHNLVQRMMSEGKASEEVVKYVESVKKKTDLERTDLNKNKTGVFLGVWAVNPLTNKDIPVWVADYVLTSVGTGAIMAVPSHDERDGEMAKKYDLPINWEFKPDMGMVEKVEKEGWGKRAETYHLRDWVFSRQHYWGEPIPMVYCEKDGWVAVPEEQLPVVLPEVEKYQPTDTGESPLSAITEWVKTVCPKCGGAAKRETDTMPNWAGSDWYFLRYLDPKNENKIASEDLMKYWLPVDVYVGGDEHNTLHLLYSRFIYQFLWDLAVVPMEYPEPYKKRVSHGVILGPDGNRMSKSKGNIINPDVEAAKYGADALRTYLMFIGPFDATMAWNERSLVGVERFLDRVWRLSENVGEESSNEVKVAVNRMVKEAKMDIGSFKFNTVVASLMECLNVMSGSKVGRKELEKFLVVADIFAPFVTEEIWEKLEYQGMAVEQRWPEVDEQWLVEEKVKIAVQVNGKLRGIVEVDKDANEENVTAKARADEKVAGYLNGEIKRVVFVPNRMINFVL